MEMALYHPDHGYYSDPASRVVGRKGDFYTSVSVGDTFGTILSHKIEEEWEKTFGSPESFVIAEQGAHDGQLARDILTGLEKRDSPMISGLEYRILEPRESVRRSLCGATSGSGHRFHPVESFEEAGAEAGIFLCNELLDAFPVRRVICRNGAWFELCVEAAGETGFRYREMEIREEVLRALIPRGEFPDGYETELCPGMKSWVARAAGLFERGRWWMIDYGHESADFFAPSRKDGTLRCYRNHRATDDPFEAVGETDITAHVNFTLLQQWAEEAGLRASPLSDQHHFLTHAAKPWLLAMEGEEPGAGNAGQIRQFQTLTHPGLMGQQFKVAEFSRG